MSMRVDENMERASKKPNLAKSLLVSNFDIILLDIRAAWTQASARSSVIGGSGGGLLESPSFDALR